MSPVPSPLAPILACRRNCIHRRRLHLTLSAPALLLLDSAAPRSLPPLRRRLCLCNKRGAKCKKPTSRVRLPADDGRTGATAAMLARAKAHLRELFPVVGVQEEFDLTLRLLEKKLPTYFEGAYPRRRPPPPRLASPSAPVWL